MGGNPLSLIDIMSMEAPSSEDEDEPVETGTCVVVENDHKKLPPNHSEGTIAKWAVKPERVLRAPEPENFKFDITCVICWKDSAPSVYYCGEGHVTCHNCYDRRKFLEACENAAVKENGDLGTCHAQLEAEQECGSDMQKVEDTSPVLKTPYFRYFRENVPFKCGAAVYGCDYVAKGSQLLKHQVVECPFRALRYCGFLYANNCVESFHDIESHLIHLFEKHKIPFFWNGDGNFLVKYDRSSFMEIDGKSRYSVVPLVRGIIRGGRKKAEDFYCIMFAKDMMIGGFKFTRIWFCSGTTPKNYKLKAECCILPPPNQMVDERGLPKNIQVRHKTLNILPDIMACLSGEYEADTFYDLPNEFLDSVQIVHKKEKYFTLSVAINTFNKNERVIYAKEFNEPEQLVLKIEKMKEQIQAIDNRPYQTHCTKEEQVIEAKLQAKRDSLREEIFEMQKKLDEFDFPPSAFENFSRDVLKNLL